MNNSEIRGFLCEDGVVDFIRKNELFYSTVKSSNRKIVKCYNVKSNCFKMNKLINIYNRLYDIHLDSFIAGDMCYVYYPKFTNYVDLEKSGNSLLYHLSGKETAYLHSKIDQNFNDSRDFPTVYSVEFFENCIGLLKIMYRHKIISSRTLDFFEKEVIIAIKRIEEWDIGGIHADLHTRNIITNGCDVKIIDFDMLGFGSRLLDLAVFYMSTYRRREDFTSFLEGYLSIRSIDLSWDIFKGACLLTRMLCICFNVNKESSFNWLPEYIQNTEMFMQNSVRFPSYELKRFF